MTVHTTPRGPRGGRPPRLPARRNLEIYHELICERLRQADVAARQRISQPRVALIRRQVEAWVERWLPADLLPSEHATIDAGRRLHLAIAVCRLKLESAYRDYLAIFGGPSGVYGFGHLLAASDAGLLPHDVAARIPRRDFICSATRMARELEDLAHVAQRGPFPHLPSVVENGPDAQPSQVSPSAKEI